MINSYKRFLHQESRKDSFSPTVQTPYGSKDDSPFETHWISKVTSCIIELLQIHTSASVYQEERKNSFTNTLHFFSFHFFPSHQFIKTCFFNLFHHFIETLPYTRRAESIPAPLLVPTCNNASHSPAGWDGKPGPPPPPSRPTSTWSLPAAATWQQASSRTAQGKLPLVMYYGYTLRMKMLIFH